MKDPDSLKLVAFRLTKTERKALDDIALMRYQSNRSRALAAALQLLFEKHKIKKVAALQINTERQIHRHRHVSTTRTPTSPLDT